MPSDKFAVKFGRLAPRFQFHPAGHHLVAQGDRVAGDESDGQVTGQAEGWQGAPGGVFVLSRKPG